MKDEEKRLSFNKGHLGLQYHDPGYTLVGFNYRTLPLRVGGGLIEFDYFSGGDQPNRLSANEFMKGNISLPVYELSIETGKYKSGAHFEFSTAYGFGNRYSRLIFQLGFGSNFTFSEKQRLILRPVFAFSYGNTRYRFDQVYSSNSNPVQVGGSNFKSESVIVFLKQNPILGVIRLDGIIRLNRWMVIYAGAGFQYSIYRFDNQIRFRGENANYTGDGSETIWKTANINQSNPEIIIDSKPINRQFFSYQGLFFSVGLGFGNTRSL